MAPSCLIWADVISRSPASELKRTLVCAPRGRTFLFLNLGLLIRVGLFQERVFCSGGGYFGSPETPLTLAKSYLALRSCYLYYPFGLRHFIEWSDKNRNDPPWGPCLVRDDTRNYQQPQLLSGIRLLYERSYERFATSSQSSHLNLKLAIR